MPEPAKLTVADSHCHIDMPQFDADRDEVVARARAAGVLTMLIVGGVDAEGGHQRALRVAQELGFPCSAGVHPHEARLYNDDIDGELRGLAGRLGIDRAITWIEHQRDIAGLFSASDVTIVPSLWSEPFGRVVIESMACETPVVASRVGGISEILTGEFAEWTVKPGQPEELASRALAIAERSQADPRIGQRARAHVASFFSLDRTIDGVEHVLLGAVERFGLPSSLAAVPSRPH